MADDESEPEVVISDGRRLRPVKSLMRALDLVEALAASDRPLGVTELAAATHSSKSAAYNLVTTLEYRGFVRRDDANRYLLGWAFLELGESVRATSVLSEAARETVDALAEATGETTLLGVADQGSMIYIQKAESRRSIRMVEAPGRRTPLHETAAGLVLLGFSPADFQKTYAAANVPDPGRLLETLDAVARQGHAIATPDHEPDLIMVAVPIFDHGRETIAALAIAGPQARLTQDRIADALNKLRASADSVGRRVRHRL